MQFILGTEDDDQEHVPHDLFTELDELSCRDGRATEWKETARSGSHTRSHTHVPPPTSPPPPTPTLGCVDSGGEG